MTNPKILEEGGQSSAEMILLMGVILIIVLVVGTHMFHISSSVNNSFKELIESGRNNVLNKI